MSEEENGSEPQENPEPSGKQLQRAKGYGILRLFGFLKSQKQEIPILDLAPGKDWHFINCPKCGEFAVLKTHNDPKLKNNDIICDRCYTIFRLPGAEYE